MVKVIKHLIDYQHFNIVLDEVKVIQLDVDRVRFTVVKEELEVNFCLTHCFSHECPERKRILHLKGFLKCLTSSKISPVFLGLRGSQISRYSRSRCGGSTLNTSVTEAKNEV